MQGGENEKPALGNEGRKSYPALLPEAMTHLGLPSRGYFGEREKIILNYLGRP